MACLALAGLATAAYSTLNGTLIQASIQDQYRGRVMSVYGMFWGLTPIGNLEMGALAEAFGVPASITVNGLIVSGFVLILLLRVPQLRKLS
jgi:DHA3 family macrolide efflux protein-like MFS transporter